MRLILNICYYQSHTHSETPQNYSKITKSVLTTGKYHGLRKISSETKKKSKY